MVSAEGGIDSRQEPGDDVGDTLGPVEETRLLGGRVRLLQPRDGYRVAMDPVMLAAACPLGGPGPTRRVLDAGVGTGAAALCLLARAPAEVTVTGIERQAPVAALARRSADLNGWAARLRILVGDLTAPPAAEDAEAFDVVMTNPPFVEAGRGTPPPHAGRAQAHMEDASLACWIAACLARLRPKGRLVVIHRADRLDDLVACLRGVAGAVEIIPLWPGAIDAGRPGARPARRVILRARKGVRGPVTLSPGLTLHGAGGGHTLAAESVLRDGLFLDACLRTGDVPPSGQDA